MKMRRMDSSDFARNDMERLWNNESFEVEME
jgi:hypothetical protein